MMTAESGVAGQSRDEALEAVEARDMPLAVKLLPRAIEDEPSPEEQAKLRLLLALMYRWNGQFDEAIAELERVAEYDPTLTASFAGQKVHGLTVYAGLGDCYGQKGDLNTAIYWWEQELARDPEADVMFSEALQARARLGARGELRARPMVVCYGFIPSRLSEAEGRLLVPATRLAENLRVRCLRSEAEEVVTFVPDEGPSVVPHVGSREARIGAELGSVLVSPAIMDGEIWVPFRFTTEALGHVVEWDAKRRIAKVRKPPPGESGSQND